MGNANAPFDMVVPLAFLLGFAFGSVIGFWLCSSNAERKLRKIEKLWEEDLKSYDQIVDFLRNKYLDTQNKYDELLSSINQRREADVV